MPEYVPEAVHFEPPDNAFYTCDGCTYNLCPSGLYPRSMIICALQGIRDDMNEVNRIRPYPCGHVNPHPYFTKKGRPVYNHYVG